MFTATDLLAQLRAAGETAMPVEGDERFRFPPSDYRSFTNEKSIRHSFAKHSTYKDEPFMVGALARLIKPGKQNLGLLPTLLLGLAGSVIGGVIASLLGTGNVFELNVLGFVVAVIAAVLLIGVAESLAGRCRVTR